MLISVVGLQVDGWAALSLAIQFVLPLLVGLVTTKDTNRERQFLLLAALTLVSTVATQVLQEHEAGAPVNLVQILVVAVVNFGVSILSHYKVWKPANLTDLVLSVFRTAPEPLTPSPAPASAALPARHLYVAPTFRGDQNASADLPLEPIRKV